MTAKLILRAVLDRHIERLEASLAKEQAAIEAALEPSIIDGKSVFYSPGDGYWKKRWQLQNKLQAARILREELG